MSDLPRALTAIAPSQISSHAAPCCQASRQWLIAQATAASIDGRTGPDWVGRRIRWGPVVWPVYWCQLLREPTGDCGVQAAIAEFTCRELGMPVRRVQLILRCAGQELAQWELLWRNSPSTTRWIDGALCYHEAVAVGDRSIRILDATEPVIWTGREDGIVALRVVDPTCGDGLVDWDGTLINLNTWQSLERHEDLTRSERQLAQRPLIHGRV